MRRDLFVTFGICAKIRIEHWNWTCTQIFVDYLGYPCNEIVNMPESISIESYNKKVTDKLNYWLLSTVLLAIMCLLLLMAIAYYFIKQRLIVRCLLHINILLVYKWVTQKQSKIEHGITPMT